MFVNKRSPGRLLYNPHPVHSSWLAGSNRITPRTHTAQPGLGLHGRSPPGQGYKWANLARIISRLKRTESNSFHDIDGLVQERHNFIANVWIWQWVQRMTTSLSILDVSSSCNLLSWWNHRMETFSMLLALWLAQWLVNSLHKGQWCRTLMFCTWINGSVSSREAGHLRHHRAHYHTIVMMIKDTVQGCYTTSLYTKSEMTPTSNSMVILSTSSLI